MDNLNVSPRPGASVAPRTDLQVLAPDRRARDVQSDALGVRRTARRTPAHGGIGAFPYFAPMQIPYSTWPQPRRTSSRSGRLRKRALDGVEVRRGRLGPCGAPQRRWERVPGVSEATALSSWSSRRRRVDGDPGRPIADGTACHASWHQRYPAHAKRHHGDTLLARVQPPAQHHFLPVRVLAVLDDLQDALSADALGSFETFEACVAVLQPVAMNHLGRVVVDLVQRLEVAKPSSYVSPRCQAPFVAVRNRISPCAFRM